MQNVFVMRALTKTLFKMLGVAIILVGLITLHAVNGEFPRVVDGAYSPQTTAVASYSVPVTSEAGGVEHPAPECTSSVVDCSTTFMNCGLLPPADDQGLPMAEPYESAIVLNLDTASVSPREMLRSVHADRPDLIFLSISRT